MPSPEKFRETLDEFDVPQNVIESMYEGFGNLETKTPRKTKSLFFKQALDVMNGKLPASEVQAIFEANACCKSGVREKNSNEFAKANAGLGFEDRLALISQRPHMNMGRAELDSEGFLVVHAVSYQVGDRFECACPTLSKVKRDYEIPREYCYCCGGHFKYHYEIMLNRKLRLVEIVSTPHEKNGVNPCVFRFEIVND